MMDYCNIEAHKRLGMTIASMPPKLLIRSPLALDCEFELRVRRDITSEEWDVLFAYLSICRRSADRARDNATSNEQPQGEKR